MPQSTTNSYGYFLVCPEGTEERAKVAAFRAWVLSEAERDGHRPPAEAAVSA
ncbi:MAG: hypothetical protein GWN54_12955 [Gammaproteobacteria bacterium]|nr:hypothetical protein [Gammaproteobacteria bacterium]NIV21453.1 hypothetical protein [Gammaproteobacteria bacterium]